MDIDRALLVTVHSEMPDQESALKKIRSALKPGGTLFVTGVIFDPHFQRRETVLKVARVAGFKEKNFFGSWLTRWASKGFSNEERPTIYLTS